MTSTGKATGKARAPRGAGSLSERAGHPGTWRLRYREGGRTRETTFTGSRSAAAAELRRRSALAGNAPPAVEEDLSRTVGELLDAWLGHIEGDKAARYVAESRRIVETRLRPALGAVRLDQLTTKIVDDAYRKWSAEGLTGASIRRYAAPLRTALGQARRWGWIETNPAELATLPRGNASAETLTPTPEEFSALVRKAAAEPSDPEMVTAIRLAYVTSARRGELAALCWSDVDLDARTVTIARSADRHGVEGPTKTRQTRTVQLDAGTVAMLKERKRTSDSEHVLTVSVNQITDRFRKLVELTPGVRPGVRFHDLRHAGASELLSAGVPLTAVAARLGHASPRTTMQVYAHALPGADEAAAAIMGRLSKP